MRGFHCLTPTFTRKRKAAVIPAPHSTPASRSHSPEPNEDSSFGGTSPSLLSVPAPNFTEAGLVNAIPLSSADSHNLCQSMNEITAILNKQSDDSLQFLVQKNHKETAPSLNGVSTDADSDNEEVDRCSEHDHFSIQVVDEILNIPIDVLFANCFTDSALYRQFVAAKKTFDVVLSPWPEEPDTNGTKVRNIAYTLSLNYAIGPKVSPSTERQIMHPESDPGHFYLVDTECINGGIPYGENFYIVNRYCITKLSSTRCRLRITSQIKYRKNVWGLVKNFIEKNASAGIIESFNVLVDLLRQESNSLPSQMAEARPCNLSRKKVLRRKRASGRSVTKIATTDGQMLNSSRLVMSTRDSLSQAIMTKLRDEWWNQTTFFSVDVLVRIICTVLFVLVIFNAVLFYKLWTLESSTSTLIHSKMSHYDPSLIKNPPKSSQEWLKLLDHQRILHESEISQWKKILSAAIELLDQMTHTLSNLRSNLDDHLVHRWTKPHREASPP